MHIYRVYPFATKDGTRHACDVMHVFAGKSVHIATTRRYVTYPAGVRATDKARGIAKRHAKSLNLFAESYRVEIMP